MKSLSLLIFLSISLLCHAQYPSMVNDSSAWKFRNWHKDHTNIYVSNVYGLNYNQDDSIINSNVYHKFHHSFTVSAPPLLPDFLVREDSSSKKVYTRFTTTHFNQVSDLMLNTDYLTYDFSLAIGDTLFTGISTFAGPINWVVLGKDSILVDNEMRAYLDVMIDLPGLVNYSDRWIEGIGSISHFHMSVTPWLVGLETIEELVCYTNPSIQVGLHNNGCNLPFGLSLNETQTVKLGEAYPNPFNDHLTLSFTQSFTGSVSLLSITGEKVLEQELTNSKESFISTEGLAKGIYVLLLQNSDETFNMLVEKN